MTDNYQDSSAQSMLPSAPFAGRKAVFAQIQQHLIDPSDRHALLFIGRRSIGKSAMLLQCQHVLGEHVIGCYLSLDDILLTDETTWLTYLYHETYFTLQQHQLNIERLPDLPDDLAEYRDWITDIYLLELEKLIRPHRRWVWLIDDIEYFVQAIENKQLPNDSLDYLYRLLQDHLQFGIIITLDEENEGQATQLTPLVDATRLQRLHLLSADETAELISLFVAHTSASTHEHIYHLTDGHPLLLQFLGQALQSTQTRPVTISEINQVIDDVYLKADDTYRTIWKRSLSQNERQVLTAISGMLYDDPLVNLTTQGIENWLLETDYPLDITTINAGIRGLEYRNLVIGSTSEGIRIRAQLFQRWLIEHAQIDKPETFHTLPRSNSDDLQIGRNGLILIVAIVIAVVLLVVFTQQSDTSLITPLQPTVTLGTE